MSSTPYYTLFWYHLLTWISVIYPTTALTKKIFKSKIFLWRKVVCIANIAVLLLLRLISVVAYVYLPSDQLLLVVCYRIGYYYGDAFVMVLRRTDSFPSSTIVL